MHTSREKKKIQSIKRKDFGLCTNVMQKTYNEKGGLHLNVFQHWKCGRNTVPQE